MSESNLRTRLWAKLSFLRWAHPVFCLEREGFEGFRAANSPPCAVDSAPSSLRPGDPTRTAPADNTFQHHRQHEHSA
jgi:hypothetical protein